MNAAGNDALLTQRIPGLAILVSDHGNVVVRTFGYSDAAHRVAVTPDTVFEIGSITKQFTAACILQLAEKHELSLDAQLAKFVPSYPRARDVTVRQLLNQVSGIPDYLDGNNVIAESEKPVSFSKLIARIRQKPLHFAPDTAWDYSNTNYLLLGKIIEVVSHEPYETYVRDHLFAPAGLTHSGFIGDGVGDHVKDAMLARGYTLRDNHPVLAPTLDSSWAGAAGAIVSTVGDLLKWDTALSSGAIIAPADVTLMRTSARLKSGQLTGYGFGLFVDTEETRPRLWHGGTTWGFAATNVTFPNDDTTVIVLTNLETAAPNAVSSAIFSELRAAVQAAPTMTPSAQPSTNAADAQPEAQTPSQRYARSVAAMRKLDIPPFVTYNTDWTSTGLGFMFAQDAKRVVLDVGTGHGFAQKHHAYSVAYRNADRVLAVVEMENTPLIGPGARVLDPTWTGAYDTVRYGLHGDPPPSAPASTPVPTPSDAGPATKTIGTVTAIAASFYRVEDAGSGVCPNGDAGSVLKLAALHDPQTHPLTQVTIDAANDRFCSMRFRIDENGVAGITGDYELDFAQSGAYWLVQSGAIDVAVRFLGIAARHVTLQWQNTAFSTPSELPATTFTPALPK